MSKLRLAAVSLDCADPALLAAFYVDLLDATLRWQNENSAGVDCGGVVLVMQRVTDYRPPVWPGASIVHLDLTAGSALSEPTARAVDLGAREAAEQPDDRWRILLDPAGHPFCITTLAP